MSSPKHYYRTKNGEIFADFNMRQKTYESQGVNLIPDAKRDKYPGRDSDFALTVIEKDTLLARLMPGDDFFIIVDEHCKGMENTTNARLVSEGCQVAPHPIYGYRRELEFYEVKERFPACTGRTFANTQYGDGGFTQAHVFSAKQLEDEKIIVFKERHILTEEWQVSPGRMTAIDDLRSEAFERERALMGSHNINAGDLSNTIQDQIQQLENQQQACIHEPMAIHDQLAIDTKEFSDLKGSIEKVKERPLTITGPVSARNILRQSDQILEQIKAMELSKSNPAHSEIHAASSEVAATGTASKTYEMTVDDFMGSLRSHLAKFGDAEKKINEQIKLYGGVPVTRDKARGMAASDYLNGEDKLFQQRLSKYNQELSDYNKEVERHNKEPEPGMFEIRKRSEYVKESKVLVEKRETLLGEEKAILKQKEDLEKRIQDPEARKFIEKRSRDILKEDLQRQKQFESLKATKETLHNKHYELNKLFANANQVHDKSQTINIQVNPNDLKDVLENNQQINHQISQTKSLKLQKAPTGPSMNR